MYGGVLIAVVSNGVMVVEEEGLFFNTKKEAIAYADEAVKVFFINFD
jgi:hypothetical protein